MTMTGRIEFKEGNEFKYGVMTYRIDAVRETWMNVTLERFGTYYDSVVIRRPSGQTSMTRALFVKRTDQALRYLDGM